MNGISSYCGIDCDNCPIHLATLESDPARQWQIRAEIAKIIWKKYNVKLTVEEITDCYGCKDRSERLFTLCRECHIRICARQKELESCAECDEYGCDTLLHFFVQEPEAKARLDGIRSR
jgi:hypothetical protein